MITKQTVQKFLDYGLNVMPVRADKRPTGEWERFQKAKVIAGDWKADNIGLICGEISGNLEVLDLDQKYYKGGDLLKDLGRMVGLHNEKLWNKLIVQETKNGGYHIIYRCPTLEGNKKIAMRPPTKEEAERGERSLVLIESRGEGGYILIQPSKGYHVSKGKLSNIPTLSENERKLLWTLCASFDECREGIKQYGNEGEKPWVHYDRENNTLDVLKRNGWSFVYEDAKRIHVRRSGDTSAPTSGNILKETGIFHCWSSSTEFDTEEYYSASGCLCVLEFGGDWKACGVYLSREGYGERKKEEPISDVTRFVLSSQKINKDSEDYFEGKVERNRSLGLAELDYYLPLRKNAFYSLTGGKASGKTTLMLFLLGQDAFRNGEKSMVLSFENDAMELQNEVIGFYCKNNPEWVFKNDRPLYNKARDFFHEFFTMLNFPPDTDFFQILKYAEQINSIKSHAQLVIDPLFKVPNTDDYSNNKKIAAYCEPFANDIMSLIVLMHPKGSVQREGGQPSDLDAEFGGLYSNAADITFTAARNYKDEDESIRNTVNFSIDKVRSKKLYGGRETIKHNPIKFEYDWKRHDYDIWVPVKGRVDQYDKFTNVFYK